jgi:hypothetical protein
MGWHTEINTMFRLGKNDPTRDQLSVGKIFTTTKSNIRIYPVDLAILMLAEDWTVLGYCTVRRCEMKNSAMSLDVEVLSLFSEAESTTLTGRMKEALTITKESPPKL